MLRSFSVENYRSFRRATIDLRPITLLLGRNSSGKSSLTRLVPLMRQSFNRLTATPVLWASDVIDFGDISNVVHHDSPDGTVTLSFDANPGNLSQFLMLRTGNWGSGPVPSRIHKLRFTATLESQDGKTRYKSSQIVCDNDCLDIEWSSSSISRVCVNGREFVGFAGGAKVYADTTNIFPVVEYRREAARQGVFISQPSQATAVAYRTFDFFLRKKTNAVKREQLRRNLHFATRDSIADYLTQMDNVVKSKLSDREQLTALSEALFVSEFPMILSYFENVVRPVFEGSSYLGPSRASGARFYRLQELSVSQIDYRGENLPMYLASLSPEEMSRFNQMLTSATGVSVNISRIAGHVSIEIGRAGNYENLADVGFGYSQLLPIVAQMHASTTRANTALEQRYGRISRSFSLMAMEQPELHLHPAMQTSLADMFVASVSSTQAGHNGLHLLIETHSEALVARLCTLVATGQIRGPDVGIYIVEKDDETKTSTVRQAKIRDDGTIDNWPFGFFTASA